jgi:DNA-binding response OmpR family regulator
VVRLPLLRSALGEVKVLEKQPNAVTSFLALPVRASEASMPTENINQNVLLIIDDNDDIRAYIRSIFAAEYYVIEAQDGQEGLQKAIEQIPDLIISDLMMPNMDGFAFCRAIKTSEKTSHIPVVMLTAKATVESRIEGFDLGADDYLTKPFHPNEIQVRVRNLLRQREQLRRYFTGQVSHDTETEPAVVVSEMDRVFLEKARKVVDAHIANSAFGVEQMSDLMNMSTRQLVRKLKALTNQTTVEFIRNHRLERAAEQLRLKTGIVSEIAYQLGFESMPYFAKVFQEKYGIPPSEYAS